MKKLLCIWGLFCLIATTSQGQINKGRVLLGGAFGVYSASSQASTYLNTNLQVGKVIDDNTVVGIIGSIAGSTVKSMGQKSEISSYSAGIFFRRYKPLANKFYFFGEGDASYQYSKNNFTYFPEVDKNLMTKSNGASIGFIPGISYSVLKRMQIELTMPNIANISYANIKTVKSDLPPSIPEQKDNIFSANINLNSNLLSNFGIGFKFLLGK